MGNIVSINAANMRKNTPNIPASTAIGDSNIYVSIYVWKSLHHLPRTCCADRDTMG